MHSLILPPPLPPTPSSTYGGKSGGGGSLYRWRNERTGSEDVVIQKHSLDYVCVCVCVNVQILRCVLVGEHVRLYVISIRFLLQ